MDATCSFETSIDFQQTTRRYIPADRTLHNYRCENLSNPVPFLKCGFQKEAMDQIQTNNPTYGYIFYYVVPHSNETWTYA
jgi:hypothetical protein